MCIEKDKSLSVVIGIPKSIVRELVFEISQNVFLLRQVEVAKYSN